jgi:phosphoserine phosphatase RsbU/P
VTWNFDRDHRFRSLKPLSRSARPRIGVLLSDLVDEYQAAVLQGARDAALIRGAHILCFVGGELDSDGPNEPQRNRIFQFVGTENIDALLVFAGAVGNRCGFEVLARFCQRFGSLPACTIGGELPGIPSVSVNNQSGVEDAVGHLIRIHGRRRIGFIRGPETNPEAEERYRAYLETLSAHDITFNPKLVAPGEFSPESGAAAIDFLFDEKRVHLSEIDALVAADDSMALGALRALEKRKVAVPGQVALVGFDDVEEARFSSPPLSTIRQPLREQGAEAVRILFKRLQGGEPEMRVVLPTSTILRRSCGCYSGEARPIARSSTTVSHASFEAELVRRRDVMRAELLRAAQGAFLAVPGWDDQLINAFTDQLRAESDRFSRAFVRIVDALLDAGVDIAAVHNVVTVLRRQILTCLEQDAALRARAEDMFQEVRIVASEAAERTQARRRAKTEQTASILSLTSRRLLTVASISDLSSVFSKRFADLGITSCYVSLFEKTHEPDGDARLIIAYDAVALPEGVSEGELFPSRFLASRKWLEAAESRAFIVMALHFDGQHLGIVVVSFKATPPYVYETLGEMIGAAVHRARVRTSTVRPQPVLAQGEGGR